ncbi:Zinc finger homeobox protein 4 [Termitomyces sp. T112]|nr:Zinc finger homeobox protein 4 [Termitomyces sp. T112]
MSIPSLCRTSSTASVDSSDDAASPGATSSVRRTRKRFTNEQLTMLEDLFHKNSHPSREERESVAMLGGMETKSVTIWFQNKRQMERRLSLSNTAHSSRSLPQPCLPVTRRPSLDCVASRSELPMPPPRTPSRRRDPHAAIWETMPSSPVAPPFSPSQREFIDFTQSHRSKMTLEWACAAARFSEKHGSRPRRGSKVRVRVKERSVGKLDLTCLTDEDTDEALTPPGTLVGGDIRWTAEPGGGVSAVQRGAEDEDMMKAALMLCDLGRRPSH